MLAAPGLASYGFTFDNWGANPAANPGTSVVPGASNVEGTFTQIATSGNIARDVYWVFISVNSGSSGAVQKDHLLDIGVDPAGGTSYSAVISNIVCGQSAGLTTTPGPHCFLFPLYIKAGSSVAARMQGQAVTAGTVRVCAKFYGDPSAPENIPVARYSETIGTITSSQGVSFTPGNAADGSWVSLGTTAQDLWWWQLCVQVSNAVDSTLTTYVDLAFGDVTNKVILQRQLVVTGNAETTADAFRENLNWLSCYQYVPAGSTIYVRGRCSGAPDTGWNAVAIGMGG